MIKHDKSATSIVTTCTECPWWFAFNFDLQGAHRSKEGHAINVHDVDPKTAKAARRKHQERTRHAERS